MSASLWSSGLPRRESLLSLAVSGGWHHSWICGSITPISASLVVLPPLLCCNLALLLFYVDTCDGLYLGSTQIIQDNYFILMSLIYWHLNLKGICCKWGNIYRFQGWGIDIFWSPFVSRQHVGLCTHHHRQGTEQFLMMWVPLLPFHSNTHIHCMPLPNLWQPLFCSPPLYFCHFGNLYVESYINFWDCHFSFRLPGDLSRCCVYQWSIFLIAQ